MGVDLNFIFTKFLLVVYFLDIFLLLYFGIHTYIMVYLFLRNRKQCIHTNEIVLSNPNLSKNNWPSVTLQLPVFNEYFVIERLIDAAIALDYPKDKLHIQVLDDSTDDSYFLAEKKINDYKKQGFLIEHLHRKKRIGHKAGALKAGLDKTKSEFIAILDADFIPSKDFLKKTIPYFYVDDSIGMVQTRWGHVNAHTSFLTKAQSIGIDGHFMIEQVARNGSKLWMNFNGTAGVWRKSCILDSGNWQSDTLTEDFDLSYRAELKGWKFKYLSNVVCSAELPTSIQDYKSQQFRWCKGSLQTAMKLIPAIITSKEKWKIKFEAFTHLLNYSIHPLMLLNILLILPMILYNQQVFDTGSHVFSLVSFLFILIGFLGPNILYATSQAVLYKNWKRRILWLPFMLLLGVGITINNTKAWLEAVFGKESSFIRTPKLGVLDSDTNKIGLKNKISQNLKKYKQKKISITFYIELFLLFYVGFTMLIALQNDLLFIAPILVIYFVSFLYIFYLTLKNQKYNYKQEMSNAK